MNSKKLLILTTTLFAATSAHPSTGPYTPLTTTSPSLPHHTIYRPATASSPVSLPIIIWGTSTCAATDAYRALNEELASWGAMVFACGAPAPALQFVEQHAGRGEWAGADRSKVGMLGAGGDAALYVAAQDPLVLSLGVLGFEGVMKGQGREGAVVEARNATVPVFYFDGVGAVDGSSSLQEEFEAVAKGVPAWYGVLPGSDAETLEEGGAGKVGRVARFWAQWMVAGEQDASTFFVDAEGAESEGWSVVRKGLDVLVL